MPNMSEFEILVTRGEDLPKRRRQDKLHPTFEVKKSSFRLSTSTFEFVSLQLSVRYKPEEKYHRVTKFFKHYRSLYNKLTKHDLKVTVEHGFPPTYAKSALGFQLSPQDLQERYISTVHSLE
jgi:hypothetical protein